MCAEMLLTENKALRKDSRGTCKSTDMYVFLFQHEDPIFQGVKRFL